MQARHSTAGPYRGGQGRGRAAGDVVEALERRVLLASITGSVYQDRNGNGVRDAGEPAHVGITVFLDQNRNGLPDAGEQSAVTDAAGAYQFTGMAMDVYTVAQLPPPG